MGPVRAPAAAAAAAAQVLPSTAGPPPAAATAPRRAATAQAKTKSTMQALDVRGRRCKRSQGHRPRRGSGAGRPNRLAPAAASRHPAQRDKPHVQRQQVRTKLDASPVKEFMKMPRLRRGANDELHAARHRPRHRAPLGPQRVSLECTSRLHRRNAAPQRLPHQVPDGLHELRRARPGRPTELKEEPRADVIGACHQLSVSLGGPRGSRPESAVIDQPLESKLEDRPSRISRLPSAPLGSGSALGGSRLEKTEPALCPPRAD